MSFKRDGDDHHLLASLKRRRVSELLANHIPEDEAILLKNGRYSCSICPHRPIFDTLSVLALHRKSKKHLYNLTFHLKKKQELKEEILKRQQEHYVKTNATPADIRKIGKNLTQQSCKTLGLLKQPHYNSCSKSIKKKTNLFDRKCRIALPDSNHAVEETESPKVEVRPSKTTNSLIRSYLKSLQRKKDFSSAVDKARRYSGSSVVRTTNPSEEKEKLVAGNPGTPSSMNERTLSVMPEKDEEKQKRTDYYLDLRAKGWKKDIQGNWIKDEDAEFDSDEDIPSEYPIK